jgi:hypothetical protein
MNFSVSEVHELKNEVGLLIFSWGGMLNIALSRNEKACLKVEHPSLSAIIFSFLLCS